VRADSPTEANAIKQMADAAYQDALAAIGSDVKVTINKVSNPDGSSYYQVLTEKPGKTKIQEGGIPIKDAADLKNYDGLINPLTGSPYAVGEKYGGTIKEVDNAASVNKELTTLYNAALEAKTAVGTYISNAAAGTGPGADFTAQAYLASETVKSKEANRKYEDFKDRASLYYDLLQAEDQFHMAGEDQNVQNAKAREEGYMMPGEGQYYSGVTGQQPLSSLLRPSLPESVPPYYDLGAATGLSPQEGYNNPNYDQFGMPMYADGTVRMNPRDKIKQMWASAPEGIKQQYIQQILDSHDMWSPYGEEKPNGFPDMDHFSRAGMVQ
jgi:hypothetical protein